MAKRKKAVYHLYSALAPDELKAHLEQETQRQNVQYKGSRKLALRWQEEYAFTLCMTEYARSTEKGVQAAKSRTVSPRGVQLSWSAHYGAQFQWAAFYSGRFCAWIRPWEDGSAVSGYFELRPRQWAVLWGVALCFAAFTLSGLRRDPFHPNTIIGAVCTAWCLVRMAQKALHADRSPHSQNLLYQLEQLLEPSPAMQAGLPENGEEE